MNPVRRRLGVFVALFVSLAAGSSAAQPKPDIKDGKYGPHKRNVFDLWKADTTEPAPLVIFIHGGGFHAGDKSSIPPAFLKRLLDGGVSVASINYRLSPEASFPSHFEDCACAIQYAREKAANANIDPTRIAAAGGSAGAGTSLWIGFHDDMADPDSDDPVLRQSTRLSCMAVFGAQSTYDPRVIREWVGDAAARHPALEGFYGLKSDELDSPQAHALYEAASPITHVTKDDPPVYAFYNEPRGPLPPNAKPGNGIHHINFGLKLEEKMDPLGIECVVRHSDEGVKADQEAADFLIRHLVQGELEKPAR